MESQGLGRRIQSDRVAEPKFDVSSLAQGELPLDGWHQPLHNGKAVIASESSTQLEQPISFRQMVSGIPSTTYGTFGLYRYPAKFIPQIVAYIIQRYGAKGMTVIDPFAGSGTTGLVSRIYGLDYELWDLNPLMEVLHAIAVKRPEIFDIALLMKKIDESKARWLPEWSNLYYWYPDQVIPLLEKLWGYYHALEISFERALLTVPLIKVTRAFSYNDPQRQKLSRSPKATKRVEELLVGHWQKRFLEKLHEEIITVLKKLHEYQKLMITDEKVKATIRAGQDTLELAKTCNSKKQRWDMLITSPPYLQAQEYIRCTKMDLFWLGYSEEYIRQLSKQELPYKQVDSIYIGSKTFESHREAIQEPHLKKMYDQYFYSVLGAFTHLSECINSRMFLFVGQASVRGQSVPIDTIFAEHFISMGWKHEATLIDTIEARVMFRSRVNPATGIKDERMPTEHMVILRK